VKRTLFIVTDELMLSGVVLLGDVLKLTGDRAKDPGEDDGLYAIPGKVVYERGIGEDVVGMFVAL
jgi:hypothetical protein